MARLGRRRRGHGQGDRGELLGQACLGSFYVESCSECFNALNALTSGCAGIPGKEDRTESLNMFCDGSSDNGVCFDSRIGPRRHCLESLRTILNPFDRQHTIATSTHCLSQWNMLGLESSGLDCVQELARWDMTGGGVPSLQFEWSASCLTEVISKTRVPTMSAAYRDARGQIIVGVVAYHYMGCNGSFIEPESPDDST